MFGEPAHCSPIQARSQPCSCLTKNDSRTPESPWQAHLGMCHKAKRLPWLERERMRGEVHTWHSDAGWTGQQPGSLVVPAQTRIYRNLFWNVPCDYSSPFAQFSIIWSLFALPFELYGKCHGCRYAHHWQCQIFFVACAMRVIDCLASELQLAYHLLSHSNVWAVTQLMRDNNTDWQFSYKLSQHTDPAQ